MPRTSTTIKNEQIAFRATNDFKRRLRSFAESVNATDGEYCRIAIIELNKAIETNPTAAEHLRQQFAV